VGVNVRLHALDSFSAETCSATPRAAEQEMEVRGCKCAIICAGFFQRRDPPRAAVNVHPRGAVVLAHVTRCRTPRRPCESSAPR